MATTDEAIAACERAAAAAEAAGKPEGAEILRSLATNLNGLRRLDD